MLYQGVAFLRGCQEPSVFLSFVQFNFVNNSWILVFQMLEKSRASMFVFKVIPEKGLL